MFDFAFAKKQLRRVVHDTLAVAAFYEDDSMSAPMAIRARWHSKIQRFGDPENQGFAEVIEGIDRIILIPSDHVGLNPRRGGVVTFPGYANAFVLDHLEPSNGALQHVWNVTLEIA